ncbi:MAG: magnesium/cobalt transporter CorA [Acidobacteria bacterium]|nr:magnesium/cobalt transporter CorA [Acidobacteriota bacterium]
MAQDRPKTDTPTTGGPPPPPEEDPEARPSARRRPLLPFRGPRLPRRFKKAEPGSPAGLEARDLAALPSTPGAARITCIDYSPDRVQVEEVIDVGDFVARHRPEWSVVRWINVDGLTDLGVIQALAEKYRLHPLAVEDVLHVPQRPRVQAYEEDGSYQPRLFVIAREMELIDGSLHTEQVSLFVGHQTLLTFQEAPGDVWDPIRQRIRTPGSQLRRADVSFLAYALIDAIVDEAFPILEHFGDQLEDLEELVLQRPGPDVAREIHHIKRELLLMRRAMWPMRELLQRMQREPHECFSEITRTYIRDVYDHAIQIIDIVETYREVATGLTETYMTAASNRMNEIMKVLTVMGSIFIPLTFLAGVYGMNFHHFPELDWPWAYPIFWLICLALAGGMVLWFRRRGWL